MGKYCLKLAFDQLLKLYLPQVRRYLTQDLRKPMVIATKTGAIPPGILADDEELSQAPTPTQWLVAQEKLKEAQLALKEATAEVEQLRAENLKIHAVKGNLHNEIAHLKTGLASLKQQLQAVAKL